MIIFRSWIQILNGLKSSFCWILKMYCWVDIINIYIHACYKLFNYIQRIWSHSSFLYQLILYQHVYWLIFVLVRRIFCNMIAVHITDLFLFLNLSKGSLEVSEYQLSFGPSSCHPCRPFIFIEPHHYFTMVYWNNKKKEISALLD